MNEKLAKLRDLRVTVCGAGAIGSNLVENLVRQGASRIKVIDHDRVEPHNVTTQNYAVPDSGIFKVDVLHSEMFRVAEVEIAPLRERLEARNVARLLAGAELVVDAFDNHPSRALVTAHCRATRLPCLHVGLEREYAEIFWNEGYRVPNPTLTAEETCRLPMARNLVLFAVALASEAIVRFALTGECLNYSFTLGDLKINREA